MFESSIAELSDVRVRGRSRSQLTAVLAAIGRLRGAVDVLEASVLSAIDELHDEGLDAEAEARSAQRCSRRDARRRVRRSKALASMPRVAAALAAGRIGAEHLDQLVRAAEETSPEDVDGSRLVPLDSPARPADLAGRDVRDWVRSRQRMTDRQDAHLRRRAARELAMFEGDDDMVVISGRLDPVSGAEIRSVLDAETDRLWRLDGGRDGASQVRSMGQRRADALHALLCRGHERGDGSGGNGDRRHEAASTTPTPTRSAPPLRHQMVIVASIDVVGGADRAARCEIPGVGPIPATELERLACGSDLMGVVFGGRGEALWHGRRHRRVTDGQWRTLVARDRGCVLCGAPPSRCEAHHIIAWAIGGPTDIDNLALLCVRCHHQLHDHQQILVAPTDHHSRWRTVPAPRKAPPAPTPRPPPHNPHPEPEADPPP
ncbi:MAG: DUF222 domain-containing protein [Acidimicrobiales bacterium]